MAGFSEEWDMDVTVGNVKEAPQEKGNSPRGWKFQSWALATALDLPWPLGHATLSSCDSAYFVVKCGLA